MFSSPLRRAITRGMKPGGDLASELRGLGDYTIQSKKDAKAICEAIRSLPKNSESIPGDRPKLRELAALFQQVDGPESQAFGVLFQEGLPLLIQKYEAALQSGSADDVDELLFVLKILAMYGTREGAEKVVEAARLPLKPDGYLWHVIIAVFSDGHPERDFLFQSLSDPLPEGFIAIALLDAANRAAIEDGLENHPFDSEEGISMLQEWLQNAEPENASYAHSATAALPFIGTQPAQDELLRLAMDHSDVGVQIEAAWAAAKLGREAGARMLARYCLDVNHSDVAKRYLVELDLEDMVPPEALEATFQAKAEFARWLAHPNELGRAPDELEVVDHRHLAWPPEGQLKPFWLMKYCLRDRTGLEEDDIDCGLVGSITWCFFSYQMHQRPPEDAYAIHCFWEMTHLDLIDENEVTDPSEYAAMLAQWQGGKLESASVTRVAECSPKLKIASRFVALASATLDGQEGWVVLDGSRSAWYPKSEQPDASHDSIILKIHIGRQILGFQVQPARAKYLIPATSPDPKGYVAAYEKLFTEAASADEKRQKELVGNHSLLERHFDRFVDSLTKIQGGQAEDHLLVVYERFLNLAKDAAESIQAELHDSFGVLGEKFPQYVDALVARNRSSEISALLDRFAPYWDHNLGYGRLGNAAYKLGHIDTAEGYFEKLRTGMESYYRCEEMSFLAEIWAKRGEQERAKTLIVDCLQRLIQEIKESQYASDRQVFASEFAYHRDAYLRLFPQGPADLEKFGIPESPL